LSKNFGICLEGLRKRTEKPLMITSLLDWIVAWRAIQSLRYDLSMIAQADSNLPGQIFIINLFIQPYPNMRRTVQSHCDIPE
jgi:hypothetical protein